MNPQSRGPSAPLAVLRSLTGDLRGGALEAIGSVTTEDTRVEEFRPLGASLEWRLADVYWQRAGLIPFVRNDVPYLVNNTGRLSESAASWAHATMESLRIPAREAFTVLEIGAGTGLYARYFLDAFAALCRERSTDFYDRLTYVVTDRYERTVTGWRESGLFEDHGSHVALALCDAASPRSLSAVDEAAKLPAQAPLFVFCNYVLDILPARIARRAETGLEHLCVSTHVTGGASALRTAGLATLQDVRALAASDRVEDLERLLALLPHFDFETTYRSWTPANGPESDLASAVNGTDRTIVNDGALACLSALLDLVEPRGFVLVNDYGPVGFDEVNQHIGVQRFGGSVALGVNFPLLEQVLKGRGFMIVAPERDEERRVHTRLMGRSVGEAVSEALRKEFRHANDRHRDEPLEEARSHVAAGRTNEALAAYRVAIERNPRDWQMLGEAAEYAGLQLRDYNAGLQIARAALERNPWCSAWLWNVLGDCLFCMEKFDGAHEAYRQAQRIDPDDPRTNLNLAYTFAVQGALDEALAVIARGLAQDGRGRGAYRARLVEKQGQVLATLSERATLEQERLVKRAARFR